MYISLRDFYIFFELIYFNWKWSHLQLLLSYIILSFNVTELHNTEQDTSKFYKIFEKLNSLYINKKMILSYNFWQNYI